MYIYIYVHINNVYYIYFVVTNQLNLTSAIIEVGFTFRKWISPVLVPKYLGQNP